MTVTAERHRFTAEEYYDLYRTGVLADSERTELVDGEVIQMAPIGSGHCATTDRINDVLMPLVSDRFIVRIQGSLKVGPRTILQPDTVLLMRRDDFYAAADPEPTDAGLVIEVSEASLRYDRDFKVPLYASAGIVEVWIVQPKLRSVTVHSQLEDGAYSVTQTFGADDQLHVPGTDASVRVDQIVG